jgi:DNA (cytosine-5)-methyltransferase 1
MLKILELFGGIGACSKALERLGIDYEIADYVEIDKYAVKSFNAIHNTNFEPQDITKWDKDIEVDLIMHGSPCQDFSLAGLQAGGDEGSGTRSSLMYETLRIVEKLKPKYVIWENVKNLLSKKHRHNFDSYLEIMESLGYKNYYQVLNAKDYGIPQNRERVFTISIKNDIDKEFIFPEKQELKLKLKDMLENNVDEKYYLSDKMINFFYKNEQVQKEKGNGFRFGVSDGNVVAKAITTRAGCRMDDNYILKPKVLGGIGKKDSNNNTQWKQQNRIYDNNVSISVCTCYNPNYIDNNSRIRKLTPKECWRLMGFDDEDFDKASQVNSNAQLYKQAGNSIVVNVLEAILKNLLLEGEKEISRGQTTIYDFI